jgi:ABC-type sugar transport system ATPase subunit
MDLYDRPANIFVAGFIGSPKMNFLGLSVSEDAVALKDGSRLVLAGTAKAVPTVLGIRADQMRLASAGEGAFSGEVSVVERLGDAEFVYIRAPWDQEIVVRVEGGTNTPVGSTVGVVLSGRTHFFDSGGLAIDGLTLARR